VSERQRAKAEKHALQKIMQAYLYLKDPYYGDALGHARALCLDAADLLEIALGIDDNESQVPGPWDKRFKNFSSG
jgi:hypothetical protein